MDKYNFDVKEMVDSFSLEDFLLSKDNRIEKEAFLLITNNQSILGYTKSFGYGEYNEAVSNSIREIYGLKNFVYRREIDNIIDITKGNFITAELSNSKRNGVYLSFHLDECNSISENQLELFKDFYDKYNEIIKMSSLNLGYPLVRYYLPNKNPYVNDFGYVEDEICYDSNDLDDVLKILSEKVDSNKTIPDEDKIIGDVLQKKTKVKKSSYVI